ncbi:MAG: hypothetical protein WC756_08565 [Taibaiella sp.]|jgi:hypothetical protein
MQKVAANKVFTPSRPAVETFVERTNKINNHLVDALNTPGKQIVLYGHTKCGKTTLLVNKLRQTYENSFTTRCMDGMSYESIILDAFDQLGKVYTETAKTRGFKISPEISVTYNEIKATLKLGEYTDQKQTSNKQIIPPQLTGRRLGEFFGASKSCWVLEDFHKIKGTDKSKTSGLMKIFQDMSETYPELKIIALGAVGTAREVVEYNQEMEDRVTEIYIPYMNDEEIEEIITSGEKLLNIKFGADVKRRIVKYSCGLPAICHQLCLNICFNKSINETAKQLTAINLHDLEKAIEKFVDEKSDTLKKQFDKSIKIPNRTPTNIPKELLIICLNLEKDEFSFDEIYYNLKGKRIQKKDAEKNLNDLCTVERSEILIYDENSNLYRFNNLFLKAYAKLKLKEDVDTKPTTTRRDEQIVQKLLDILDKDILDEYEDEIYIEDL